MEPRQSWPARLTQASTPASRSLCDEQASFRDKCGQLRLTSAEIVPNLADSWLATANFGRNRPKSGRLLAKFAEFQSNSPQRRPNCAASWPDWTEYGPTSVDIGPNSADNAQVWSNPGQCWPKLSEVCTTSVAVGLKEVKLPPGHTTFGRFWSDSVEVRTRFGRCRARIDWRRSDSLKNATLELSLDAL